METKDVNITIESARLAKDELAKKINALLHDFVKETSIVPCGEITAKISENLIDGEMKRTSVTFDINIKIWI